MIAILRLAVVVAAKDLRQRLRDRSVLVFAVAAPLALAVIFSQLLAGATDFHARYVVADQDGGATARVFRDQVLAALVEAGVADVSAVADAAAAQAVVEDDGADAAFVLPPGFSDAVAAGQAATIRIIGRADAGLATEIARSVAGRFGDGVAAVQLSVATVAALRGGAMTGEQAQAVVAAASAAAPPASLVDVRTPLRQLSWTTYFSASMAIMFLFFAAQIGMISLFEERRQGTLARMLAGPVAPSAVLLGKVLSSFATAAMAMAILIVATTVLIRAEWGPIAGVLLLVAGAVLAAIGIAVLVTSFMRTADGASAAGSAVAITLAILGGSFTPTSQAPEAMATLALVTPHGWFLRGLGDMQGGGGIAGALPAAGILLAIGAVTLALGFLRARRLVTVR